MNKKAVFGMLLGVAVLCGGCGKQAFDRQRYALMIQRPDAPPAAKTQALLEVRPFSIDAAFASRSLTYRRTEHKFETDFYHEYLVGLNVMITDQTRQWLAASRIFADVFSTDSLLKPTYILEGNIGAAYMDISEQGPPAARLEITFRLLDNQKASPSLVFGSTYTAVRSMSSGTPEAYVEAQQECLRGILAEFEDDLVNLAGTPPGSGTEAPAGTRQSFDDAI